MFYPYGQVIELRCEEPGNGRGGCGLRSFLSGSRGAGHSDAVDVRQVLLEPAAALS